MTEDIRTMRRRDEERELEMKKKLADEEFKIREESRKKFQEEHDTIVTGKHAQNGTSTAILPNPQPSPRTTQKRPHTRFLRFAFVSQSR